MIRFLKVSHLVGGILISLGWCLVAHAGPAGRYVANEDLKVEVLMGRTVAGTMLLKKGRQFQVTGSEGEFIQIELGQELKGRLPRAAESKIALASAETPQQPNPVAAVTEARPPQPEKSDEAAPPKPAGALAIKGVYIGMSVEDAMRVLTTNTPIKLRAAYADTIKDVVRYRVEEQYVTDQGHLDWRMGGELYVDRNTRKVTLFGLYSWLSNQVFNSWDVPASVFAQRFIDSYRIPELKTVMINGEQLWHYESPHGWSVYISPEKRVELFETPKTRFD